MGATHGTYAFFGVHIPRGMYQAGGNQTREIDWIEAVIDKTPRLNGQGLGYITAGEYDRDELFLTVRAVDDTKSAEVELGTFRRLDLVTPYAWTALLGLLVREAGYPQDVVWAPGWIVVPDHS